VGAARIGDGISGERIALSLSRKLQIGGKPLVFIGLADHRPISEWPLAS